MVTGNYQKLLKILHDRTLANGINWQNTDFDYKIVTIYFPKCSLDLKQSIGFYEIKISGESGAEIDCVSICEEDEEWSIIEATYLAARRKANNVDGVINEIMEYVAKDGLNGKPVILYIKGKTPEKNKSLSLVTDSKGDEISSEWLGGKQPNIAEFIALKNAIVFAANEGYTNVIIKTSNTNVGRWYAKQIKPLNPKYRILTSIKAAIKEAQGNMGVTIEYKTKEELAHELVTSNVS